MKKILTIILDGFGMREDSYGNAVKNAGMENFINIWNKYPHCLLKTSGEAVGLPKFQALDSTLGHKIIGAGREIKNRLSEATRCLEKEELKNSPKFKEMLNYLKNSHKTLHIIFLLSDGGVSSHINHLKKMLDILTKHNVDNNICIHVISDGKDSGKYSLPKYIKEIEPYLDNHTHIASICGSYYALNETKAYDRVKVYYDLLFDEMGVKIDDLEKAINIIYNKKLSDEYMPPLKTEYLEPITANDVVLFLNFSKFNQIELFNSIVNPDFLEFDTYNISPKVYSLYEIDEELNSNYFLNDIKINHTLGEYISELGLTQARIAESIRMNNITYFLDGEKYLSLENNDVFQIETPKLVTFDVKPELNSLTVSKTVIECMENDYDFIICNFANPDVVGHTGNYRATINSLQAIDLCLGKIIEVAEENFYSVIILGSHPKVDTMIDRDNNIVTKNTINQVPFIIMDKKIKLDNGSLISVAPTILHYMDIALPKEMKNTEILIKEK